MKIYSAQQIWPACFIIWMTAFGLAFWPSHALAQNQDMRADHVSLEQKRKIMEEKADRELSQAREEAQKKVSAIKQDKSSLTAAIAKLKAANVSLEKENQAIESRIETLREERVTLKQALSVAQAENKELSGFVRSHAKDLESLLIQSLQSGILKGRHTFLKEILSQEKFPSMDLIRQMADTYLEEIRASGEVRVTNGTIVDRSGTEKEAQILVLGNFSGIYTLAQEAGQSAETGFLIYSAQSRRLFALSKLPASPVVKAIEEYLKGERPDVPVDISKGAALRRLTHELDLVEQVPKGGPIVWPILAILVIALLILIERFFFFTFRRVKVEPFMAKVEKFVANNDWDQCKALFDANKKRLVPKVLLTALPFRDLARQDMENALQEAILGEIPRVERFLSTLGMLAAIAPLMGLLGTVTGMINTFHVITCYGAGDPRMMSGGISEALVTTMLGLTVAIPIMIFHTFLSRKVDTQISRMEEKSVAFVNMVFKVRNAGCCCQENRDA